MQEKLEEGRYQNASEVVRAGFRLLQDAETVMRERRATIRAELAEQARDGRLMEPASRVFEDLCAQHVAQEKADTQGV